MHDYYRIADVWDGSRRASRAVVRAPWWRTLPGTSPQVTARGGRARVLDPEGHAPFTWRDDVALDFPSTRGPAERMQRAFLAQDAPPTRCAVAVDVPRRRTLRTSRVPIEVAVPALCGPCGGRGEAWGDPCADCAGAGVADRVRYVVLRMPAGVRDGARLCYRLDAPHMAPLMLDVRVTLR